MKLIEKLENPELLEPSFLLVFKCLCQNQPKMLENNDNGSSDLAFHFRPSKDIDTVYDTIYNDCNERDVIESEADDHEND